MAVFVFHIADIFNNRKLEMKNVMYWIGLEWIGFWMGEWMSVNGAHAGFCLHQNFGKLNKTVKSAGAMPERPGQPKWNIDWARKKGVGQRLRRRKRRAVR